MDAVAEREVVIDRPRDVEAVGIGEVALVVVPRRGEQHHHVAGGDRLAVVLDVLRDVPGLHRRRRLVAQRLLDRVRDEAAVVDDLAPFVGVLREQLAHPADEAGGGLVAGAREQPDVAEDLLPAEPCG